MNTGVSLCESCVCVVNIFRKKYTIKINLKASHKAQGTNFINVNLKLKYYFSFIRKKHRIFKNYIHRYVSRVCVESMFQKI